MAFLRSAYIHDFFHYGFKLKGSHEDTSSCSGCCLPRGHPSLRSGYTLPVFLCFYVLTYESFTFTRNINVKEYSVL